MSEAVEFFDYFMHRATRELESIKNVTKATSLDSNDACGFFSMSVSPLSGNIERRVYRCKNWRECENCAGVRDRDTQSRVVSFMEDRGVEQVYERELNDKQYAKLLRTVGRQSVVRFPQEDGVNVVLVATDTPDPGDVVRGTSDFDDTGFIRELSKTPARKRISGWSPPAPEAQEGGDDPVETVAVYQREYLFPNPIIAKELAEEAILRTRDLYLEITDPAVDLQWAIDARENMMLEVAEERGVLIHSLYHSRKIVVRVDEVNWKSAERTFVIDP